jgi:hypothetical protein
MKLLDWKAQKKKKKNHSISFFFQTKIDKTSLHLCKNNKK